MVITSDTTTSGSSYLARQNGTNRSPTSASSTSYLRVHGAGGLGRTRAKSAGAERVRAPLRFVRGGGGSDGAGSADGHRCRLGRRGAHHHAGGAPAAGPRPAG